MSGITTNQATGSTNPDHRGERAWALSAPHAAPGARPLS